MSESQDVLSHSKFTLNNGTLIPAVGLGTYRIRAAAEIMKTIDYALDAGYRMFDTAAVYSNEVHLKTAFQTLLPKYGLERKDIFITTKLSPSDHGSAEITHKAYERSLNNMGLDYIDLYLIHFPGTAKLPSTDTRNKQIRLDTWASLAELYDERRVNAIGVSNFTVRHLRELMMADHGVTPAVNQIEWHPYYHQQELLNYCKENNILLQAYCSFGGTSSANPGLLQEPVLQKIAQKYNVTTAQVALVWSLKQGVAVIPKSTNPNRIKENIRLNFHMTYEEIRVISKLGDRNIKYAWDPNDVA